jgi:hypothetical protein
MADHQKHNHNAPYETTDANARTIVYYTIGLFVTIAVAMVLMGALYYGLGKMPADLDREPTSMEMERMLPPTPRLQYNQQLDLADLRKREGDRLNSYGWVMKQSGTVHIPIDRAIDLVSERGLKAPVVAPAKPTAAAK